MKRGDYVWILNLNLDGLPQFARKLSTADGLFVIEVERSIFSYCKY